MANIKKKGKMEMKKFLKGLFIFIKVIIVLCLIFLSTYAIFSTVLPLLQSGVGFIDMIKEIAIYIWASLKSILGIG